MVVLNSQAVEVAHVLWQVKRWGMKNIHPNLHGMYQMMTSLKQGRLAVRNESQQIVAGKKLGFEKHSPQST